MRGPRLILDAAEETPGGIRLLTLKDQDGWELPPFTPGAHVDVYLPEGISRSYSLCNDPIERDRYVLAVKREEAGRGGSRYICDQLAVGDDVFISIPRQTFPLDPSVEDPVFIAGGIGVTPFLSMGRMLLRTGKPFHLHVLSRGVPPAPTLLAPLCAAGRVTLHDTAARGRPDFADLLGDPGPNRHAYACGPEAMLDDFSAVSGWPTDHLHVEYFVPPPIVVAPDAQPYTLELASSGRTIEAGADETVLQALRRSGIEVDATCEGGICGACKLGWIDGVPIHRDKVLSPAERQSALMACVAGCASARLVLDI